MQLTTTVLSTVVQLVHKKKVKMRMMLEDQLPRMHQEEAQENRNHHRGRSHKVEKGKAKTDQEDKMETRRTMEGKEMEEEETVSRRRTEEAQGSQ